MYRVEVAAAGARSARRRGRERIAQAAAPPVAEDAAGRHADAAAARERLSYGPGTWPPGAGPAAAQVHSPAPRTPHNLRICLVRILPFASAIRRPLPACTLPKPLMKLIHCGVDRSLPPQSK